jgi:hypothetical protein
MELKEVNQCAKAEKEKNRTSRGKERRLKAVDLTLG